MLRRLNCSIFRRITTTYLRPAKYSSNHLKPYFTKGIKLLATSQICCAALKNESQGRIDINDGLQKACEEGGTAIIKLMGQLKEFVVIVSKEYRSCLIKQIEITEAASNIGPLSEVWDELPRYRILADELNQELNDYMALLNTIGQMTYDKSLIQLVTNSNEDLKNVIDVTFKELEMLLQKEFEQNRKMEQELLKIKRDSILKGTNCD